MENNDIFKAGTKVKWIIYQGTDPEEIDEVLSSARHLLFNSPIITKIAKVAGIDVAVKLIEIKTEQDDTTDIYTIRAIGVVV